MEALISAPAAPPVHRFFLDGGAGPLYAAYFVPSQDVRRGLDILVLPALADEMNKSRRMLASQGRALSAAGIGMLIVDLYGTGDSAGDFAEARWDIWRRDVAAACAWLQDRGGGRLGVIALRMGSLLLPAVMEQAGGRLERLVLWQPALRGDLLLTQFLRLRTAATSMQGEQQTPASLRETLAGGSTVEIAGYDLAPDLAQALDEARLDELRGRPCPPVSWFELVPESLPVVPRPSQAFAAAWRDAGTEVSLEAVAAPPFWSGQQITVAPELLRRTTQEFERESTDAGNPGLISVRG